MHKKKSTIALWVLLIFALFPIQALAVEYSISNVTIEAQVNADGTVDVTENHTYRFEGEFNGITREIIPKGGTLVQQFSATEGNRKLKVEHQENVYKVFRSGEDETITIEIRYEIQNAIVKFEDGAQFYWPFFDDRNDSDYEQLAVTVLPPAPAKHVDFVGYDQAYQTGNLQAGGSVRFDMGTVSAGSNGDVRIIFDEELFPGIAQQDGTIRSELTDEKDRLEAEALAFSTKQNTSRFWGNGFVAAAGAFLLALVAWAWNQARQMKLQAKPNTTDFFVPKQKMSIPATLYFTKSSILTPAVTAAALMELVRKKNIEQLSEEKFKLISRQTDYIHEEKLLELLFDKTGDGEFFETTDLENYTKNELNHSSYNDSIAAWRNGVVEEVREHNLHDKHLALRVTTGFIGTGLFGAAIYFGLLDLLPLMIFSIITGIFLLAFCFYSPITYEGHVIREEWKQLQRAMENLDQTEWNRLTQDDKMRAYSYLLGAEENSANQKTQSFTNAYSDAAFANFGLFYNPVLLTGLFIAANANTTVSASTTDSFGGGGGVGGGGGGSGAF
ncbi:putative membrane protein [Planococcus halocryophilus Or1]|uniref:DUF2207 domain-containing protein n=1 Tax=Planococcus halocryophilus TaxID=1215089 RepID=A0A1C7DNP8_9BACL|nr:DUF2207 domain-containing protein [Planococcus halocryophilus]ANU13126.1 hypothetical protein BBI08_04400 [Planococcus halocryophilus]EMF47931.1 putative membrane protein [Planococcus halocryophilus Or1]